MANSMSIARASLILAAFCLVTSAVACDDGSVVTNPPVSGGPLIPGTWYLHGAEGDTMPAKIHERRVGAALEETIVDSAQLTLNADGSYAQRIWSRVIVSTLLDRHELLIDHGTFFAEGQGFRLVSSDRDREFTLTVPALGQISTLEQMLFLASDPPITAGSYRLSRP